MVLGKKLAIFDGEWGRINGAEIRPLEMGRKGPEIDHKIISTVILLPSAESFKKGCCQLQAIVCARSTGLLLVQACPGKSVVR